MKSLFRGSAVIAATILASSFLLSATSSVAETPLSSAQKPKQELNQDSKPDPKQDPPGAGVSANGPTSADARNATTENVPKTAPANESMVGKAVSTTPVVSSAPNSAGALAPGSDSIATPAAAGATYTATAYSLPGRTANGMRVTKGLIAADPRVLPLGTRVRLDAGMYSGEYLVADTGGVIRGKKIDIWTPSTREACRFGRRLVKLTVLSYPAKRAAALQKRNK